jgi:hypothetical protein
VKSILFSILFFASLHVCFSQVNTDSLRLPAKRINKTIHQMDSANSRLTAGMDGQQLLGDSTMRASYQKVDSILRSGVSRLGDFPSQRSLPLRGLRVYLYSTLFLTIAFIVKSMSFLFSALF